MRVKILFLALTVCATLHGGEKLSVVAFNGLASTSGAPMLAMPLDAYGIETRNYWPDEQWAENLLGALRKQKKTEMSFQEWQEKYRDIYKPINDGFAADLEKAQLLYVGQYTHDSAGIPLDKYPDAVKKFIARGGVMFFDYFSLRGSSSFMKSVEVENPGAASGDLKLGDCAVVPWDDKKGLSFFKIPNAIDMQTQFQRGYGWWEKWSDKQFAPLRNAIEPEKHAVMIIQENVLGKGKMIFNHYPPIFRGPEAGGNKKLLENTLSYIFGRDITKYKEEMRKEQGGPGEPAK